MTTLAEGFDLAWGIAVDSKGNVYLADSGNRAVKRVDGSGTVTILSRPEEPRVPVGVAVSSQARVYVLEYAGIGVNADANPEATSRVRPILSD